MNTDILIIGVISVFLSVLLMALIVINSNRINKLEEEIKN